MDVSIDGRRTLFHFFISETSRDIKVTNMGAELQSQNRADGDYEKPPIRFISNFDISFYS